MDQNLFALEFKVIQEYWLIIYLFQKIEPKLRKLCLRNGNLQNLQCRCVGEVSERPQQTWCFSNHYPHNIKQAWKKLKIFQLNPHQARDCIENNNSNCYDHKQKFHNHKKPLNSISSKDISWRREKKSKLIHFLKLRQKNHS